MLLVMAAVGCGRVGIRLLPLAATDSIETTAGRSASDDAGSGLPPNILTEPSADAAVSGKGVGASTDAAVSGQDAGPTTGAPADAGMDAALAGEDAGAVPDAGADAGAKSTVDAGASIDAGTQPACGGRRVFGLCWYLGAASTSCTTACSTHGGFDDRSIAYVGTPSQGGSLSACTQILDALAGPGNVVEAKRTDGNGLGCHVWTDGTRYWLIDPPFSPTVATPSNTPVRIACGCQR